ncbi:MAG: hypothetical protein A2W31_05590 [Planctomycetes bacterium RBG_16_64_10]|nr:MAG: hypothetical protein A2W31_05590 [Planctomycetes bacterium RBG_16_64_10]
MPRDPASVPPPRPLPTPVPDPRSQVEWGDWIVARAAAAIGAHASVAATMRQRAELFGRPVFGKGRYCQQGRGEEMRTRIELKVQVDGQISSMLQIADGQTLWTDWQQGTERKVLSVDLQRVRAELDSGADSGTGLSQLLVVGGLPDLMASLAMRFQFDAPTESRLGDLPTYCLLGRWRAEQACGSATGQTGAADGPQRAAHDSMPAHVPTEVQLVLGRDDLFPHVIEYRRGRNKRAGQGGGSRGASQPLLRMELFDVQIAMPLDPRQFVYRPGDVESKDDTARYLAARNSSRSAERISRRGAENAAPKRSETSVPQRRERGDDTR